MTSNLSALAVGRLVPIKGFDRVIHAWRDIAIPLEIVGDGPERLRLQSLIRANGVSDRVRLTGENTLVTKLMKDKDILVAPSLREGFSYVVLEALQAELCVVSTRTGIAPDLIPNEFLLEQPTATLLAERVSKVIKTIDETRQKFQPVWERAKQLTVQRMVDQTLAVYQEAIDSNQCRS